MKTILRAALFASVLFVGTGAYLRAQVADNYAQGELVIYGAQLNGQTVEVTAFEQGERSIEVKGHVTMRHDNWVKFSRALGAAGFPVRAGEPKPIAT